jgi:hypothetical protein
MIEAFEFVDGDRKYRCHVRAPSRTISEAWWWFDVSGDQQMYAAFRAASNDTKASVRSRVLSFYTHRLARLAEPPQARHPRGRPPGSGAAKAAEAAVEVAD